jgi:hypothetical protein
MLDVAIRTVEQLAPQPAERHPPDRRQGLTASSSQTKSPSSSPLREDYPRIPQALLRQHLLLLLSGRPAHLPLQTQVVDLLSEIRPDVIVGLRPYHKLS